MKMRTIGVMTAGILSLTAFIGVASAQCPPVGGPSAPMIEFDFNNFAYEPNYNLATFQSTAGNMLTIVGIVDRFYAPIAYLNPGDPATEYTFVITNLISQGTVTTPAGPTTFYQTQYNGGTFAIYEDSPENAPLAAAMAANPFGGATVPANFQDGTAILTGEMCGFSFTVTRTQVGTGPISYGGNFGGTYRFTNPNAPGPPPAGNLYNLMGDAQAIFTGNWCGAPGSVTCRPANYIGQLNGKWDSPPTTPAVRSTWGTLKSLYR